jgi:creatinine amidohydrolase
MITPFSHVQLELLRPEEIDSALAERSVVYVPLGSIEYHATHLPVGLDGLTAHGVCLRAADRTGGVVYPVLYCGTGGGHTEYRWTVMLAYPTDLRTIVNRILERLQSFGVQRAVLFTGHFADEQLAVIEELAAGWIGTMGVVALGINQCPQASVQPDHAGVFETSVLSAFWPDRVRIAALPAIETHPAVDPGGHTQGAQRHSPDHPLYGIFGPDPREFNADDAGDLAEQLVDWLAKTAAS